MLFEGFQAAKVGGRFAAEHTVSFLDDGSLVEWSVIFSCGMFIASCSSRVMVMPHVKLTRSFVEVVNSQEGWDCAR